MWKETIICTVIVVVIIIANIITQNYTVESIKKISDKLERLKEDIIKLEENENQENLKKQSKEKMSDIKKDWDSRHDKLAYYIEHDELEKVETDLTGLESCIEMKEYGDAMSELKKSAFVLKHIEEKYAFNLENVF